MDIINLKNRFNDYFSGKTPAPSFWFAVGAGVCFLIGLIIIIASSEGIMALGMQGLGIVLPFYFIVSLFVTKVNSFGFIVLFLVSGFVYVTAIYYIGQWVEQALQKYTNRPRFVYRKISMPRV